MARKKELMTERIHWKSLNNLSRLYFDGNNYRLDGRGGPFIVYHAREANQAERFLKTRVKIG